MGQDNGRVVARKNEAKQRYEVEVDGQLAVLTYRREGNTMVYLHTAVPSALSGRGIADQLARTALEEARDHQYAVVPQCPFVAAYIRRHPAYMDLVEESQRSSFSAK
jgi:uncharacterized protein